MGTIGGGGSSISGEGNRVTDEGGTVAGGTNNQAGDNAGTTTDAAFATVGGGEINVASGIWSTVGGGGNNMASSGFATVGGGANNTASGNHATVPGGRDNTASGEKSFAAGRNAKALHSGSFVWGDDLSDEIASTDINQFIVRASGGFWLSRNSLAVNIPADGFIGTSTGGYLSFGGTWTNASDAALKEHFQAVDPQQVLDQLLGLSIQTWSYKAEDAGTRHLGPTAQAFAAAFELGGSDTAIGTVDADGVALAAIQGLHALLVEKDTQIKTLQRQLDDLQAQVSLLLQQRQP